MSALDLIQLNLLSPIILCFLLGIAATLLRSDMRFPEQLYHGLSIYLLLSIGFKGGVAMVSNPGTGMFLILTVAVLFSAATPLWIFPILRKFGRFSTADSAAIAAHYGSVSVVTFLASVSFLQAVGQFYEGFMPAVVAVMEVPGIIVALLLVQRSGAGGESWGNAIRTVLTGKSVFLLLGGLVIGILSGERGMLKVEGFFVTPFQGVLCLFLLEMGMVASRRFDDLRKVGPFLIVFSMLIPILHAFTAIWISYQCGLSRGGALIFGVLAASASYIAAPATVRLAIPQASPALYLTSTLAITFPFNLTIGIPLYYAFTGWIY